MSIRMLALELYKVKRQVEELERKLAGLASGNPGRSGIENELRVVRAEAERLKHMLEGAKSS